MPARWETSEFAPLREVDIVHNPALGSFLIWKAADAFQDEQGEAMPMLLGFLVLPLLLHRPTLEIINSTNKSSGLALLASKIGERKDDLLAIHSRALILRSLGLASLAAGIASRFLIVNYQTGDIRAAQLDRLPSIPERIKPLVRGAERVGVWFSRLPIRQVASVLRVEF